LNKLAVDEQQQQQRRPTSSSNSSSTNQSPTIDLKSNLKIEISQTTTATALCNQAEMNETMKSELNMAVAPMPTPYLPSDPFMYKQMASENSGLNPAYAQTSMRLPCVNQSYFQSSPNSLYVNKTNSDKKPPPITATKESKQCNCNYISFKMSI
jgi:hypothetical protein